MQNEINNQALEYVKKIFENDYSGHDYFHTFRVYKMATHIAMNEEANIEIVQLAALLHDVDDIWGKKNTINIFLQQLIIFMRNYFDCQN